MNLIVTVRGLTKKIGRKQVLRGIDFQLEAGKVVGLLGPNGAGKTTLLKTLMNIYHPDSGEILISNEPVSAGTKGNMSYMPDGNLLFPWMRVDDAIEYYGDMYSDFDIQRAGELCEFLNIEKSAKVKSLSKGNQERVLIMLTFSRNTKLYLLDEPLDGIDPLTRNKIIKTIFSKVNGESTILISTHLVKDVETLLDEVLFINEGKLIFRDYADSIREKRGQSLEECYMEVFQNA
jgi:ABC-2 type transport system ATP-binding protein